VTRVLIVLLMATTVAACASTGVSRSPAIRVLEKLVGEWRGEAMVTEFPSGDQIPATTYHHALFGEKSDFIKERTDITLGGVRPKSAAGFWVWEPSDEVYRITRRWEDGTQEIGKATCDKDADTFQYAAEITVTATRENRGARTGWIRYTSDRTREFFFTRFSAAGEKISEVRGTSTRVR